MSSTKASSSVLLSGAVKKGATKKRLSNRAAVTILLAVLILVPSMVGFVNKFVEFFNVSQESGAGLFAVAPMLNYILASLGFLCMLVWAAFNGMFHDIERPKFDMLENEALLNGGKPAMVKTTL
jgi:hypothetical protein